MRKEAYEQLQVKELLEVAKNLGVKNRHDMKKARLIERILEKQNELEKDIVPEANAKSVFEQMGFNQGDGVIQVQGEMDEVKVDLPEIHFDSEEFAKAIAEGLRKGLQYSASANMQQVQQREFLPVVTYKRDNEEAMQRRQDHLCVLEPGTIVAVIVEKFGVTKCISAAMENINKQKRVIKVRTKYDVEHIVNFDDVVWIKTGLRWPRYVLDMLIAKEIKIV